MSPVWGALRPAGPGAAVCLARPWERRRALLQVPEPGHGWEGWSWHTRQGRGRCGQPRLRSPGRRTMWHRPSGRLDTARPGEGSEPAPGGGGSLTPTHPGRPCISVSPLGAPHGASHARALAADTHLRPRCDLPVPGAPPRSCPRARSLPSQASPRHEHLTPEFRTALPCRVRPVPAARPGGRRGPEPGVSASLSSVTTAGAEGSPGHGQGPASVSSLPTHHTDSTALAEALTSHTVFTTQAHRECSRKKVEPSKRRSKVEGAGVAALGGRRGGC